MEEQYYIILSVCVGMGVTFGVMPSLLNFCKARGYYDQPSGRKVHHCAVPRLGGLLFMPAMLVSLAVIMFFYAKKGY